MPFKDRTEPKERKHGKYPWDFKAPTKDYSHSGEIQCGDNYGTGVAQPIGTEKVSGKMAVPQESKCWSPSETFKADKRG
jgi:hypothetical protein